MSFVQRAISLTFDIPGSGSVKVSGLRVSATIVKAGGAGMTTIQLRIFGLSPSLMQQLSTYGAPVNVSNAATVEVLAGDVGSGSLPIIALGVITAAYADYSQMPEVAFNVEAHTGVLDAIKPAHPTSINGAANAAQIMQTLAGKMGYTFENNGVSVQLSCPYFAGSLRTQAADCAEAGDFNWIIDDKTLAIWPHGGSRKGAAVLVSADTGMVGYPSFLLYGIVVKMLLNPNIKYASPIEVKSTLKPANGVWSVVKMVYELESETPDGAWFLTVEALNLGYLSQAVSKAPSNG